MVKKIRQSNFELMRIISMFLIVIWHIIVHGGLLYNTTGATHSLVQLILCIIIIHVNSFVLITGYFQYDKDFSLRKFFSTFNAAWFYKAAILIIFVGLGIMTVSKGEFVQTILPIDIGYWFIATYLALYALSPFLNKLIKNLSKKEFQRLILIMLFAFSLIPFITQQGELANNGSNIITFIILYFIGAYLAKYPITKENILNKISNAKYRIILLSIFILMVAINFAGWMFYNNFSGSSNSLVSYLCGIQNASGLAYSNPFVIIQSICYFLLFSTFNFKNKFINTISPLVFGVYLIHDNRMMRSQIYEWFNVTSPEFYASNKVILYLLLTGIIIFTACIIIEFIRHKVLTLLKGKQFIHFRKRKIE